jgi:hypothetical protein
MFGSDCAGSVRAGNGGIILALDSGTKEDGGSRPIGTDVVERNQDLLDKPGSFFRSRHTARVRLAHPLIAIPGDNTVDHISKRPGNDDEGIHPGPNPGKAAKNFEGRRGFREDPPVFQQ